MTIMGLWLQLQGKAGLRTHSSVWGLLSPRSILVSPVRPQVTHLLIILHSAVYNLQILKVLSQEGNTLDKQGEGRISSWCQVPYGLSPESLPPSATWPLRLPMWISPGPFGPPLHCPSPTLQELLLIRYVDHLWANHWVSDPGPHPCQTPPCRYLPQALLLVISKGRLQGL